MEIRAFEELGCSKRTWRRICGSSKSILVMNGESLTDDDGFCNYDDCTLVEQLPSLYERLRKTTEELKSRWMFFDDNGGHGVGAIESIVRENEKVLERCNMTQEEIEKEEHESICETISKSQGEMKQ